MALGQTFLSEKETIGRVEKRHLFIIIADQGLDYLAVPIDTWHDDYMRQDDNCILNAGDHPFIKHKSWVNFRKARIISAVSLFNRR